MQPTNWLPYAVRGTPMGSWVGFLVVQLCKSIMITGIRMFPAPQAGAPGEVKIGEDGLERIFATVFLLQEL